MTARLALALALLVAGVAPAAGIEPVSCVLTPSRTVDVASPTEGVLAAVLVERGDRVAAGQPLARVESSIEEAALAAARHRAQSDAAILSRAAQLREAEQRLAQTETLRARGVAAETQFNQVVAEVAVARALLREAQDQRETARLEVRRAEALLALRTIRAPIDGVVLDRRLDAGEYASEQAPVVTVVAVDPLHAEILLPSEALGAVEVGARVEVAAAGPRPAGAQGVVTVVDPVVDPASRTFGVRVAVPNPAGALDAGLRCAVSFEAGERS